MYIGGSAFGARKDAANSVDDIRELCNFAHLFGCKVWSTLNTILYDSEIQRAVELAWQLWEAGVDGLLIQDMGLLEHELPPIRLHASTQCDNRDADKLRWLHSQGFRRAVLARELSASQIADLNRQLCDTNLELEAFVHGALCVSYSGQCYMSEALASRSANRGACAQMCRQRYDLLDSERRVIAKDRYALSLKDLDRSACLRSFLDAGVTSLKIEGRLKDADYVSNIVYYYRRLLDDIFAEPDSPYCRASEGNIYASFEPDPQKTFHRDSTPYLFPDSAADNHHSLHLANHDTPKSTGEPIGTVRQSTKGRELYILTDRQLHPGDGLQIGQQGCYVNSSERQADGITRVMTGSAIEVKKQQTVFRNYDKLFHDRLHSSPCTRLLPVDITISETPKGFLLRIAEVEKEFECEKSPARNPEIALNAIRQSLSKLGGSLFEPGKVTVDMQEAYFIPASQLNSYRREVVALLTANRQAAAQYRASYTRQAHPTPLPESTPRDYRLNVSNDAARTFYSRQGADAEPAFEISHDSKAALMTCRYCLLRELGQCRKNSDRHTDTAEPAYLRTGNRLLRLHFDCAKCQMQIFLA